MPDVHSETPEERAARWAAESEAGAAQAARDHRASSLRHGALLGGLGLVALGIIGTLVWLLIPAHGTHTLLLADVKVGTCFPDDPNADPESAVGGETVKVTDCSKPHRAEAFAFGSADAQCPRALTAWAGPSAPAGLTAVGLDVTTGTKDAVICIAVASADVTGTLAAHS